VVTLRLLVDWNGVEKFGVENMVDVDIQTEQSPGQAADVSTPVLDQAYPFSDVTQIQDGK